MCNVVVERWREGEMKGEIGECWTEARGGREGE